ncbi:MAG: methyltransferase domain-containing protein [Gammaproteobacteria bacterium]|nr:methyltransferase domain-containing protein [Gammaproteobacteria bacterium]
MTDSRQRQQDWEQRYSAGKTGWDRGSASPALVDWLARGGMPRGRVLVPGCGHGHEVAALVRHGCDVTAVDIASQPVATLRRQLDALDLAADVVQADLLHWQPAEAFDAVYEQTCICAIDPAHWSDYERRLADWLRPGGQLFGLFMQTGRDGGPPFDCPMPGMRRLFDDARWRWPDSAVFDVPHPNGFSEKGVVITRR